MAARRSEMFNHQNAGYYHLTSRSTGQTFCVSTDSETGPNDNSPHDWIKIRLMALANIFSVEIYAYAITKNRIQLVVYSDPQLPHSWPDKEVAERWLKVCPGQLDNPKYVTQRELRLQIIISSPELLVEYRKRLGSLFWFMYSINEPVAGKFNAENTINGGIRDRILKYFMKDRFFEPRLRSMPLSDKAAALACMAYIDLNPKSSRITKASKNGEQTSLHHRLNRPSETELTDALAAIAGQVRNRNTMIPLKDYVELVEWTGQSVLRSNTTPPSPDIFSIFETLNIAPNNWLFRVENYDSHYYQFVGSLNQLKSQVTLFKQRWLKSIENIRRLYLLVFE